MFSHPVKSLALFAIVSATSLFSAADISKILKESNVFKVEKIDITQLPTLTIKTIYNKTPYDILLVDRLAENSSIILPAGKTIEVNFKPNNQNEVIFKSKKFNSRVMAKRAQYVFKKLDQSGNPEPGKILYFNSHMTGASESFILKCYVTNANGYCGTITNNINGYFRRTAEFELELSMDASDVSLDFFGMRINGKLAL